MSKIREPHQDGEIQASLQKLERENRILQKKLARCETNRKSLEEAKDQYDTVFQSVIRELDEQKARMKRDLGAAARVQQALLPTSLPESDEVCFAWQYHPCDELGGDALNVHRLSPTHISLYIVDVSGHGVPAALLSVSVARSLEPTMDPSCLVTGLDDEIVRPGEVAQRLNMLFPNERSGDHYFTMVYGTLDIETGRFRFITAGHPGPILIRYGSQPEQIKAPAFLIGALPGKSYSDGEVELAAGDRLYLYSDGLYEETNPADEQFEIPRLMETLAAQVDQPLEQSLEAARERLAVWHGSESFTDDFSILGLEMTPTY